MIDMQKPVILIVDDTPANIHLLAEALKADYHIKVATNGPDALELAGRSDRPDLILLDVMMPDMDGYEVCRRLRGDEATKEIPVIFITANSDSGSEEYGLDLGAVDYITKPFKLPVVRVRIRNQMNLKRKTELLETLASLDGLTGIPNRRRLDEALDAEWKRAMRNSSRLSLIMVDVDHFKLYNDHNGHGAGDECLRKVAAALLASLERAGDMAARYGGEEFAILLPETNAEGACMVAERIRYGVERLAIPHASSTIADIVTISVGCATISPLFEGEWNRLLAAADKMLYRAKQEGRNRVFCIDLSDAAAE